MGGLLFPFGGRISTTRCESPLPPPASVGSGDQEDEFSSMPPPPKLRKIESFDEKLYRKFSQQPLVPIGCAATAYFLASGIKSFRDRDPVKSQRMMKYRVMAQFVTLICFCGYIGIDKMDWRIAPMYQDAKKIQSATVNASDRQGHESEK